MATVVTFDVRSGCILGIHHGAADEVRARKSAQHHAGIDAEHIGVIVADAFKLEKDKRYKVDISRRMLVPIAAGEEGGVWFGFGSTGSAAHRDSCT